MALLGKPKAVSVAALVAEEWAHGLLFGGRNDDSGFFIYLS